MSHLEGVYWDLDGTIANTELEAHLPAFNYAFKDLNLEWFWDEDTYIKLLKINGGKRRLAHYASLKGFNYTNEFIIHIHKTKQKHYLNIIESGAVTLKRGVLRLINELKAKNTRQFIVTSSSSIQTKLLVKKLFVDINPFEFYITSEDVELHKPNPLPYLKAISLSGIKEENSIVFEDSNPGFKSSSAANLPTICVQSNIPTKFDNELSLNCLIDTLGDYTKTPKIIYGPKLNGKFINHEYLINFLDSFV